MKTSIESAAKKSAATRERLVEELEEQLGKATEEELSVTKWDIEKSEIKNFDNADEIINFPEGKIELVNISGNIIKRITLAPGWKSTNPEKLHFQFHLSGIFTI